MTQTDQKYVPAGSGPRVSQFQLLRAEKGWTMFHGFGGTLFQNSKSGLAQPVAEAATLMIVPALAVLAGVGVAVMPVQVDM